MNNKRYWILALAILVVALFVTYAAFDSDTALAGGKHLKEIGGPNVFWD
ncbi:MAG: hypothetical protein HYU29_02950 [Chloroflexi bacterium]|nr:hypothetical protein [Chloroflexota bacterium]